jgi:protoheme IX farnesyltransferase
MPNILSPTNHNEVRMMAQAQTQAMPHTWRELLAITKPRITMMVLFTTAGGIWLAPTSMSLARAIVAVVATTLIVGAANALNCYLERESDKFMSRTQNRPLPAGRLDPAMALLFGLGMASVAIPLLALGVNQMTGLLGALAFFSYVWIYTPLKKVSPWALEIGAIPGAIPPLLGWTAATGRIELPGLVLFGILFLWQLPHFLAIALYRKEEYRRAGLQVLPVVRGDEVAKRRIPFQVAALVACSLLLYPLGVANLFYFVVACLLGGAFLFEALRAFGPNADNNWARRIFIGSLFYVTFLFVAIGVGAQ